MKLLNLFIPLLLFSQSGQGASFYIFNSRVEIEKNCVLYVRNVTGIGYSCNQQITNSQFSIEFIKPKDIKKIMQLRKSCFEGDCKGERYKIDRYSEELINGMKHYFSVASEKGITVHGYAICSENYEACITIHATDQGSIMEIIPQISSVHIDLAGTKN